MLHLQNLLDDATCYDEVRERRWPEGVRCPHCASPEVTRQGPDTTQPSCRKYRCTACRRYVDDWTGTIFAGHHQPRRVWLLCLYLMGLNLSNEQIGQELGLNKDDVHRMTSQLRTGIVVAQAEPMLSGEVECDEVSVVAGHKGHPEAVKKGRKGRRRRLKGARGRGTLEEATDLRDAPTRRGGGGANVGKRTAADHQAVDPGHHHARHDRLHRRR